MDEELVNALYKRAKGFKYKEVHDEYTAADEDNSNLVLLKRKVDTKYVPPDISALKAYMELSNDRHLEDYTDEELEEERKRLIRELIKNNTLSGDLCREQKETDNV